MWIDSAPIFMTRASSVLHYLKLRIQMLHHIYSFDFLGPEKFQYNDQNTLTHNLVRATQRTNQINNPESKTNSTRGVGDREMYVVYYQRKGRPPCTWFCGVLDCSLHLEQGEEGEKMAKEKWGACERSAGGCRRKEVEKGKKKDADREASGKGKKKDGQQIRGVGSLGTREDLCLKALSIIQ